jgi:lipoprotein-releasing system permease protein
MSVAITTSLIILLAGFGIFNVLTMSVLAKIKRSRFCVQWVTAVSIFRDLFVAGSADRCGRITARLSVGRVNDVGRLAHSHSSPRLVVYKLFFGDMGLAHYVFATFLALLAVFIASYVPARRAAELPPVVTIRGSR